MGKPKKIYEHGNSLLDSLSQRTKTKKITKKDSVIENKKIFDIIDEFSLLEKELQTRRYKNLKKEFYAEKPCYTIHREEFQSELPFYNFSLPLKPVWTEGASAEEIQEGELRAFMQWKNDMRQMRTKKGTQKVLFEQNLEIWRQLWFVLESSHLLLQILDARNPQLFYCSALEDHLKQNGQNTPSCVILNKADLVPEKAREEWRKYFSERNCPCFFYTTKDTHKEKGIFSDKTLFEALREYIPDTECAKIGIVGYPNVGKSSFLNTLFPNKRVAVGKTPGKTKHVQTLYLDEKNILLDCPGLVFPSLNVSQEEYILNGVISIDSLKCLTEPIALLLQTVGKGRLKALYKVEFEGKTSSAAARSFLEAYARKRGLMRKAKCGPDETSAGKLVLKDLFAGVLPFSLLPSGVAFGKDLSWEPSCQEEETLLDQEFFQAHSSLPSGYKVSSSSYTPGSVY